MTERKISVFFCDFPHRREARAVDSLLVRSALGGKERRLDVCGTHRAVVMGEGATKGSEPQTNGYERLDKVPPGWVDAGEAAELLGLSRSAILSMNRAGTLKAREVSIPGYRSKFIYIFDRDAVKQLAKERG